MQTNNKGNFHFITTLIVTAILLVVALIFSITYGAADIHISTIMDADLILVLDQGKVVGQGTHKELLDNNEVYQEIAYSQLSKEELEHGK